MGERRWSVVIVLLVSGVLLWTGCGGSGDEGSGIPPSVGSKSELAFYDWSANVLGPAHTVDRFVTRANPDEIAEALGDLRRRWTKSGRPPEEGLNRELIMMGAEPTREDAVRIARYEQKSGNAPQGAIVISEQAVDPAGVPVPGSTNRGYFAINDAPALTGQEILSPTAALNPDGRPNVTFRFTAKGQAAFQKLTRRIARRGQSNAMNCGSACPAVLISDWFVIALGDRVLQRVNVNFLEYPDGLDGRTGFQIDGGFSSEEADSLASALK